MPAHVSTQLFLQMSAQMSIIFASVYMSKHTCRACLHLHTCLLSCLHTCLHRRLHTCLHLPSSSRVYVDSSWVRRELDDGMQAYACAHERCARMCTCSYAPVRSYARTHARMHLSTYAPLQKRKYARTDKDTPVFMHPCTHEATRTYAKMAPTILGRIDPQDPLRQISM